MPIPKNLKDNINGDKIYDIVLASLNAIYYYDKIRNVYICYDAPDYTMSVKRYYQILNTDQNIEHEWTISRRFLNDILNPYRT